MNTMLPRVLAMAGLLLVSACASHERAPITSTTTTTTESVQGVPPTAPTTTTQVVHTY